MKFSTLLVFQCVLVVNVFAQEIQYFDIEDIPCDVDHAYYYRKGIWGQGENKDTVRSFYVKNDVLRSRESIGDRMLEGPARYYYPNGALKKEANYHKSQVQGTATEYFSNGAKKQILIYFERDQSKPYTAFNYKTIDAWDSTGKQTVKNYQGYIHTQTETGKIKDGKTDSTWTTLDSNGHLLLSEQFKNGEFIEGKRYSDGKSTTYKEYEAPAAPADGM